MSPLHSRGSPNKGGQNQKSKPLLGVTMMPLGAHSISKYGSLVRPGAQIVALRAHCASGSPLGTGKHFFSLVKDRPGLPSPKALVPMMLRWEAWPSSPRLPGPLPAMVRGHGPVALVPKMARLPVVDCRVGWGGGGGGSHRPTGVGRTTGGPSAPGCIVSPCGARRRFRSSNPLGAEGFEAEILAVGLKHWKGTRGG